MAATKLELKGDWITEQFEKSTWPLFFKEGEFISDDPKKNKAYQQPCLEKAKRIENDS